MSRLLVPMIFKSWFGWMLPPTAPMCASKAPTATRVSAGRPSFPAHSAESVPKGMSEAGLAIGLTPGQIRRRIIVPIMLRAVLPALGSTFIGLFKDTSLAAAIAVPELTFEARKINVETFRVIETWLIASGLYVATCAVLAAVLRRLEARLALSK